MRNYYFYYEGIVSDSIKENEVIEKVIKEEAFAKEPGLELSGGSVYMFVFVLIVSKFRKFSCNLQK